MQCNAGNPSVSSRLFRLLEVVLLPVGVVDQMDAGRTERQPAIDRGPPAHAPFPPSYPVDQRAPRRHRARSRSQLRTPRFRLVRPPAPSQPFAVSAHPPASTASKREECLPMMSLTVRLVWRWAWDGLSWEGRGWDGSVASGSAMRKGLERRMEMGGGIWWRDMWKRTIDR